MRDNIYEEWKHLRNYLAKTDVLDDLFAIHTYSARRTLPNYKPPIPDDIRLHPSVDDFAQFTLWELEAMTREVIISSDRASIPRHSFKNPDHFADALNLQKTVENAITAKYINQDNILHEVTVRLPHRQFKYQSQRPTHIQLLRYAKLFNSEQVAPFIERKTDLSPVKISVIGAAMFGNYLTTFANQYRPSTFDLQGISWEDYEKFVEYFAIDIKVLREKLKNTNERHLNDEYYYEYHSLYSYPLIKTTNRDGTPIIICPMSVLLHWRISSGLYYDVVKMKHFDNAFGSAFENYVGEVIEKTVAGTDVTIYPGEEKTPNSPHRTDWIIDKVSDGMLVECKTKRLALGAKVRLFDETELNDQLEVIADAVLQSYQTYIAYKNHDYANPRYPFD